MKAKVFCDRTVRTQPFSSTVSPIIEEPLSRRPFTFRRVCGELVAEGAAGSVVASDSAAEQKSLEERCRAAAAANGVATAVGELKRWVAAWVWETGPLVAAGVKAYARESKRGSAAMRWSRSEVDLKQARDIVRLAARAGRAGVRGIEVFQKLTDRGPRAACGDSACELRKKIPPKHVTKRHDGTPPPLAWATPSRSPY